MVGTRWETRGPGRRMLIGDGVLLGMDTTESRPIRSPQGGREPRVRPEEILDAATDLFAEFGYSDAVTNDLAEKLGVGKGTIYRHYPSKRALFLAAVDRVMIRQRAHI